MKYVQILREATVMVFNATFYNISVIYFKRVMVFNATFYNISVIYFKRGYGYGI